MCNCTSGGAARLRSICTGDGAIGKRDTGMGRAPAPASRTRRSVCPWRAVAWYRARGGYRADRKLIALVAVMRKLARALWHVARGAAFDSTKLVDARALGYAPRTESPAPVTPSPSHEAATPG
ncbi:MAG: hypothetical protein M5U28_03920 [Sandaracinaceae bacterium]|nr:hypothetical protein [Sandaracinaceae bacterium]